MAWVKSITYKMPSGNLVVAVAIMQLYKHHCKILDPFIDPIFCHSSEAKTSHYLYELQDIKVSQI